MECAIGWSQPGPAWHDLGTTSRPRRRHKLARVAHLGLHNVARLPAVSSSPTGSAALGSPRRGCQSLSSMTSGDSHYRRRALPTDAAPRPRSMQTRRRCERQLRPTLLIRGEVTNIVPTGEPLRRNRPNSPDPRRLRAGAEFFVGDPPRGPQPARVVGSGGGTRPRVGSRGESGSPIRTGLSPTGARSRLSS